MFGLSRLYTALILSGLVLAIVGGGYWYVKSLQNKVTNLTEQNITLVDDNKELTKSIEETNRMNDIQNQVTNLGDEERSRNRQVRDNQLQGIDRNVRAGKDRPVGPLLKDFFNEQ
jgi:predicted PurR-regulated permease PerM